MLGQVLGADFWLTLTTVHGDQKNEKNAPKRLGATGGRYNGRTQPEGGARAGAISEISVQSGLGAVPWGPGANNPPAFCDSRDNCTRRVA